MRTAHWWISVSLIIGFLVLASGWGEQPFAVTQNDQSALYFPPADGEWAHVSAKAVGWNRQALDAALIYAEEQRTSGLVILHRGRLLVDAHWELPPEDRARLRNLGRSPAFPDHVIEDVASVQKSVVSLLVGVALDKELLSLDDSVSSYLGDGWSRASADQEAAITLRHLMSMTSGLSTDLTFEAPAGDKWMYNTNAYSRLLPVLEAASGLEVAQYTTQWLTAPLGMRDSAWAARPWVRAGADANRVGFRTTARDLARLGLLILAEGGWDGVEVLPDRAYLRQSLRPSQDLNPSYGLLWWVNGQPRSLGAWVSGGAGQATGDDAPIVGSLVSAAPDDLVAAQGAGGRKLYVVPSLDLVVSRLGARPESDFNNQLWRRLMAAAPSS